MKAVKIVADQLKATSPTRKNTSTQTEPIHFGPPQNQLFHPRPLPFRPGQFQPFSHQLPLHPTPMQRGHGPLHLRPPVQCFRPRLPNNPTPMQPLHGQSVTVTHHHFHGCNVTLTRR